MRPLPIRLDEIPVTSGVLTLWRFVPSQDGSLYVQRVARVPAKTLAGKVIATTISLANGDMVPALISNIDIKSARRTQHFLTISLARNGVLFHLARYFDHDYGARGPKALAAFLQLKVREVFPITYDVSGVAPPGSRGVRGQVLAAPKQRLTRAQVIALAVL